VVRSVAADGGNLIIPAFAVGRTQDLLYYLNKLQEAGRVPELPVYVDSPLATSATQIFRRHQECFDQEARGLLAAGDDPFSFPGLTYVRSPQDSMALNQMSGAIIISASGMANAGRVLHHLKHNLWRPESTVLFVGYQAEGTLGRALLGGVRDVHVLGEAISVRAKIRQLSGFSAHADQAGLMAWARGLDRPPAVTFVVHGEQSGAEALAGLLKEAGHRPRIPALGDSLDIARDAEGTLVISDGERRAVSVELAAPARRGNGLEREVGSALAALRRFRQVLVTGQYNGEQNGIAYTDLWKELRRALKDVGLVMARAERRSRHGEDH
ncbi:MAG: MBL fold metallo-hydrolase RNA specificity domain-containing protein, partial [Bacillota bacterium]